MNVFAPAGSKYDFAIYPNGKASPQPDPYDANYYLAFLLCTRQSFLTGYNNGADGMFQSFNLDGSYAGPVSADDAGSPWPLDINTQVFGQAVPEPITMTLVGMSIAGIGAYVRRRAKAKAE